MLNFFKITLLLGFTLTCSLHASPSNKSIHVLNILNQWNSDLGKKGLLLHDMNFDEKFTEFKKTNEWFEIDRKYLEKDKFYQFATDKDGASYYLWFYPELSGEPPVVVINMSDYSADSVTENIEDLVCSLIKGETLSGGKTYNHKSEKFLEVETYKKNILKELNCAKKIEVWSGLHQHPKFEEWLEEIDEKYQK